MELTAKRFHLVSTFFASQNPFISPVEQLIASHLKLRTKRLENNPTTFHVVATTFPVVATTFPVVAITFPVVAITFHVVAITFHVVATSFQKRASI